MHETRLVAQARSEARIWPKADVKKLRHPPVLDPLLRSNGAEFN
jgi:hypothetical protein